MHPSTMCCRRLRTAFSKRGVKKASPSKPRKRGGGGYESPQRCSGLGAQKKKHSQTAKRVKLCESSTTKRSAPRSLLQTRTLGVQRASARVD